MKIALLGGTFNPVHNGHILLADKVRTMLGYDKILFVPSFIPAHKEISGSIPAEERLYMLTLAISKIPWADFSDCEIVRKGISYTYETLQYIKDFYSLTEKPGLIIGDDLVEGFSSWRNPQCILELADLIVAHRLYENEMDLDFPHQYINNDIYELSSSQIRRLIESGTDTEGFLPKDVFDYLTERDFYHDHTGRN